MYKQLPPLLHSLASPCFYAYPNSRKCLERLDMEMYSSSPRLPSQNIIHPLPKKAGRGCSHSSSDGWPMQLTRNGWPGCCLPFRARRGRPNWLHRLHIPRMLPCQVGGGCDSDTVCRSPRLGAYNSFVDVGSYGEYAECSHRFGFPFSRSRLSIW